MNFAEKLNIKNTNMDDKNANYDDSVIVIDTRKNTDIAETFYLYCANNDLDIFDNEESTSLTAIELLEQAVDRARIEGQTKIKFWIE